MISADVSCTLLEADFSGIEAVLTGYGQKHLSSVDAFNYIRTARMGVHALVAARALGTPADVTWPDDRLKGYLTEIKHANTLVYDTSKRTVHMVNFGGTPYGMCEKFPTMFPTIKSAEKFINFYYDVAPSLRDQQSELRRHAREAGFLGGPEQPGRPSHWDHPYGYRHWFWDVLSYQPCDEFTARKWLGDPLRASRIVQMHGRWFKTRPGNDWNRCVPPSTKVLMGDYTYKQIGDVKVGETVIGWTRGSRARSANPSVQWTHYANKAKKYVCDHLVRSKVTATHALIDQTLTITLASGQQIRCTADHQWQAYRRNTYEWFEAGKLRVGDRMARLDVTDPGDCPAHLRETAAWLAGFYDGEGSITGVTQRVETPGDLLVKAEAAFAALGFETVRQENKRPANGKDWKPCVFLKWLGGRQAALKFYRWVPSHRFRAQWADRLILGGRFRRFDPIVKIEPNVVAEPLVCITTETGNFIADDLCSHNCIAFYPQSIAAGRLKEVQRRLFLPWSDDYIGDCYFGRTPLLAPIHDSLLLHVPNRILDRVTEVVCRVMQEPSSYLPVPADWGFGEYLPIGISAKAGKNWAPSLTADDIARIQSKAAAEGKPIPSLVPNPSGMDEIAVPKWTYVPHAGADDPILPVEERDDEEWAMLQRSVA